MWRRRTLGFLLLLALVFTLLNAVKPLSVDDAAYYYYARQMAEKPADPYGFEILWYEAPEPANHVLAPPVLPYWWSLAIRLFEPRPFFWKLWLFPFHFLLVASLHFLFRRFARGMENPLVIATVFSPSFLPSSNLMLDIPAIALSLGALALFLRAADLNSWRLTLAAGLAAGLAMQTKYNAFLTLAILLLFSLLFRTWRLGLAAVVVSLGVFFSWEWFVYQRYGESHFLYHLDDNALLPEKVNLFFPFFSILGGVGSFLGMLGLVAVGASRRALVAAGGLVILGYALHSAIPEQYTTFLRDEEHNLFLNLGILIFGTFGFGICGIVGWAGTWWWCRRRKQSQLGAAKPIARVDVFLVLWLILEIAGYFTFSPFPAVRRVLGVVGAGTMFLGRVASRTCRSPKRQALVWQTVLGNVLLGLVFYTTDLLDAYAEKDGAEIAARWIHQRQPEAVMWYVGHWGFQFYAEHAGMRPVVTGTSFLRQGDWLVIPDERIEQQRIAVDERRTKKAAVLKIVDWFPFRTIMCFYGGPLPLEHREGVRLTVRVYRISAPHVATAATEN